jgi:hypothetical protein
LSQEPLPQDTSASIPEDFSAFEAWRRTGELPKSEEAPEVTPEATAEAEEPETAPDSEPEDDQEQDEEGERKPRAKGKGGFQRRIDRLTRELHERDQRLDEMQRRLAGEKPAAQPQSTTPADKPKLETFQTYEEYVEAVTDWKLESRIRREQAAVAEWQQREQQRAATETWNERVAAAKKTLPDFDDVMEEGSDLPITPALQQTILESELGPQLAYHLAQNPQEVARLSKLSPIATAREIGRLEAKLSADSAPKPTAKTSKAPEPIKPVSRPAKTAVAKSLNEVEDFAEYEKRRKAGERR